MNSDLNKSDITVLGGGLAGLSFAIHCRQKVPGARITVLEKQQHPVPEAAFKVGESTVEAAAPVSAQGSRLERPGAASHQRASAGLLYHGGVEENSHLRTGRPFRGKPHPRAGHRRRTDLNHPDSDGPRGFCGRIQEHGY